MKKNLASALTLMCAGAALLLTTQAANAHNRIDWSVNVGVPLAIAAPPVVYGPPAVVYGRPRYVYQEPVQVQYGRHYNGYREHEWRERERREYYYWRHHRHHGHEPYRGRW